MGAALGPGSQHRRGRGVICAAVTLSCTPSRAQRRRSSAGSTSPPASVLSRVGGVGRHFRALQHAAAPGPWVEGWEEERRGPELEWRRDWSPALPAPSPRKPEVDQAAGGDGVRRDLGPSSPLGGGGGRGGGGAEPWQTQPSPPAVLRSAGDLRGAGLLPGRLLPLLPSKPVRPEALLEPLPAPVCFPGAAGAHRAAFV